MKLSELIKGKENLIVNEKQSRKIAKILNYAIEYPNCDHEWICTNSVGYHQTGIFEHIGMIEFYKCSLCGERKKEYI